MSTSVARLGEIKIDSGSQYSAVQRAANRSDDAYIIGLCGTSTQAETYSLQVTYDAEPSAAGHWFALQDGSTTLADLPVPAQNKAAAYPQLGGFTGWRIAANGVVGGDRTWQATKQYYAFGKLR